MIHCSKKKEYFPDCKLLSQTWRKCFNRFADYSNPMKCRQCDPSFYAERAENLRDKENVKSFVYGSTPSKPYTTKSTTSNNSGWGHAYGTYDVRAETARRAAKEAAENLAKSLREDAARSAAESIAESIRKTHS